MLLQVLAAFFCLTASADQVIDFDREIDFATIRSFAIRNTAMGIDLRNKERDAAEVARNLPGYARKLLAGYPRGRK